MCVTVWVWVRLYGCNCKGEAVCRWPALIAAVKYVCEGRGGGGVVVDVWVWYCVSVGGC